MRLAGVAVADQAQRLGGQLPGPGAQRILIVHDSQLGRCPGVFSRLLFSSG
jgi:hypothetical protein